MASSYGISSNMPYQSLLSAIIETLLVRSAKDISLSEVIRMANANVSKGAIIYDTYLFCLGGKGNTHSIITSKYDAIILTVMASLIPKNGRSSKGIKSIKSDVICMVDNCYGEFVQTIEPSDVGADLIVGSLIKNPGGGLAPCGGYIAGKKEYVEQAAYRLTSPGLG